MTKMGGDLVNTEQLMREAAEEARRIIDDVYGEARSESEHIRSAIIIAESNIAVAIFNEKVRQALTKSMKIPGW